MPPDSKLGSSDKEDSLSTGKNIEVVLVPCCAWKCNPTAFSGGVNIRKVSGVSFLQQMSSRRGSQSR